MKRSPIPIVVAQKQQQQDEDLLFLLPDDVVTHIFSCCGVYVPLVFTTLSKVWQDRVERVGTNILTKWVNEVKSDLKYTISAREYKIIKDKGGGALITKLLSNAYQPTHLACNLFRFMRPTPNTTPTLEFYRNFMRWQTIEEFMGRHSYCRVAGNTSMELRYFYLVLHMVEQKCYVVVDVEWYSGMGPGLFRTERGDKITETTKIYDTTYNGHEIKYTSSLFTTTTTEPERLCWTSVHNFSVGEGTQVMNITDFSKLLNSQHSKKIELQFTITMMLQSDLEIGELIYYLNMVQELKKIKEEVILSTTQYLVGLCSSNTTTQ